MPRTQPNGDSPEGFGARQAEAPGPSPNRREFAYLQLRADIVNGRLRPGEPLGEVDLADRIGVSRTPVREALQRLAVEGLVSLVPGRGAFVSGLSVPDVVELFQLREALEACSARLAAKSEDRGKMEAFLERFEQSRPSVAVGDIASYYELAEAFDLAVVDLAGNGRIRSALADVWAQSAGVRRLANQNRAMILATIDEHSRIARAIADGAEVEASDAATEHIRNSLRNVIESLAWPMASRR